MCSPIMKKKYFEGNLKVATKLIVDNLKKIGN